MTDLGSETATVPIAQDTSWHIDKHIPVVSLLAVLIQTAAFVWWAATMTANVSDHEKRLNSLELRVEAARATDLTLAKLQVQIEGYHASQDLMTQNFARVQNEVDRIALSPANRARATKTN